MNEVSAHTIRLRNVRVNNLQNVSLDIPHGQWLAVCGLSGSGKSSLAFDCLFAEGQRRYLDCLSTSARQFVTQWEKPDADLIDGLPPAIAVQRAAGTPDRKSTVGNETEILEHLRLMFARVSKLVCPICNSDIVSQNPQSVAARLSGLPAGTKLMIAFSAAQFLRPEIPPDVATLARAWPAPDVEWSPPSGDGSYEKISTGQLASETETIREALLSGRRNGFLRAVVGDQLIGLDDDRQWDATIEKLQASPAPPTVEIVVDRLAVELPAADHESNASSSPSSRMVESLETAFQFGDGRCVIYLAGDEFQIGERVEIDSRPFRRINFSRKLVCSTCSRVFSEPTPQLFSFQHRDGACPDCHGTGTNGENVREVCSTCAGCRLKPDALAFQLGGMNIAELCRLSIAEAIPFFAELQFDFQVEKIGKSLLQKIETRLRYLQSVGLDYLSLDRPTRTLSTGEAQRVSLTTCLSSTLVNMLYVLDEPSVGLHTADVARLTAAIGDLHARGNTVVVVDHEPELISAAPRIIELGPGAGNDGGHLVFDGDFAELLVAPDCVTGDFLAGRRGVSDGSENRRLPQGKLRLFGASGNNLKNVDVEFPLGLLCVVTGVSGAGKSSLVGQTLYGAVCQQKQSLAVPALPDTLPFRDLAGADRIDEIVLVDQSPIGRTARSNPVTYVKAFDEIRKTFAETPDAKAQKLTAGAFSFNVAGGRCEKCDGMGWLNIDMQFLAEVSIRCDECGGARFKDSTLAVRYRGLNIAEVLDLTVREAFSFFRGQPKVQSKLKALIDVGLEYIRLGQPATTLSSGEAQRLKLAVYLNASAKKRALFLLDEPTTGLHPADVTKLACCFDALLTAGHSLIVVEHNLQLIRWADWVIDLGPGAGAAGGEVVACGPPEEIAKCSASITGRYLPVV